MTKDTFDLPDMDELTHQLEDAMTAAQKALADLPVQMEQLGDITGSFSALMGGMPAQLGRLAAAMEGFEEEHESNVTSLAGEPDWSMKADIWVAKKLHLVISASFDLEKIKEAWSSTQNAGFESLVTGVVAGTGAEIEAGMMGQIMGQLKQGRSIAVVEDVKVRACRIQGAPRDAAAKLQLSPEGNIPLAMSEDGLGFELAPMLTIRNKWENANIPTFSPLGKELVVSLEHFENGETFNLNFKPAEQEEELTVELSFQPLE
ncbi:MAG: hypothetical protein U9Q70_08865 [Chloroflexota bacterium]|nr:hypothetical protein [Chloroflexota bacterium]